MCHSRRSSLPLPLPLVGLAAAAAVLLAAAAGGCGGAAPVSPESSERMYIEPGIGVSFAVPAAWVSSREGVATVLSGPRGTDSYYTTLTLQASPPAQAARADPDELLGLFDAVLDATYAPGSPIIVSSLARSPLQVGDLPALHYLARFTLYELARQREGLLFRAADGALVNLSYTAPATLFAQQAGALDRALETLSLWPGDGGLR